VSGGAPVVSDVLLDDALLALRWFSQRNVDFAGPVHVIAMLRVLLAVATPGQSVRIELLVNELRKRWSYWAPEALDVLAGARG
jgi:hypothetical protein